MVTQQVRHSKPVEVLGRIGMACYGVVHILVAWLAIQVVFGDSEQTDQKGAVAALAETPIGPVLLWALAIGLFAYGLWQLLMVISGYGWIIKKRKRITRKIGAGARGVVGVAIGVYAVQLATGSGSSGGSSNDKSREATAALMSAPAGVVLVGIAALVIIGVAIAAVRKGVKQSFVEDLNEAKLPKIAKPMGTAGYCAKGVSYAIIGILVGIAAIDANPNEAGGLDAALKTLQQQTFGDVLLFIVAIGFAAFGVYCFAAARAHKG
ncbi:DUF1206 domain-containing protein [Actinocrispum sp. NPDC049592]|uniref:DUF1206 domain-containing protein n=1 Tax=Actinocrispum sp. NPDC049592 TaxID=3154835 RepID=UPI00344A23D4